MDINKHHDVNDIVDDDDDSFDGGVIDNASMSEESSSVSSQRSYKTGNSGTSVTSSNDSANWKRIGQGVTD